MIQIHSIEVIMLAIAISLDSFAIMSIEGAMLSKINMVELVKVGILFGGSQAIVLLFGNTLATRLMELGVIGDEHYLARVILTILAAVIFIGLGVWMLWNGLKNDTILETRKEHLNMGRMALLALLASMDGLLVGIGLSLLNTSVKDTFIAIVLVSMIGVTLGVYTGYRLGFEQKTKAYIIGACILIVIGFQILIEALQFGL